MRQGKIETLPNVSDSDVFKNITFWKILDLQDMGHLMQKTKFKGRYSQYY